PKPTGIPTHQVKAPWWGFREFLNERKGRPHWPVHRLDRETSGTLLFALNKETAGELGRLFEQRQVKKNYLFVTQSLPKAQEPRAEIEQRDDHWVVRSFIQ